MELNRKEYEYSFRTNSLESYIKYCKENNYNFIEEIKQIRTIYRNKKEKTIARITKQEYDENAVKSILSFLNYTKDNNLIRTRKVFELGDVKFELDQYEVPEKLCVIAIVFIKLI